MSAHWLWTRSGRSVDLLEPSADQINVFDIAHALARIERFNAHARYSVAEHCLNVGRALAFQNLGPRVELAGYLHDAHEAFIGDLTRVFQGALEELHPGSRNAIREIRRRVDRAILDALVPGLWIDLEDPRVEAVDHAIVTDEKARLFRDHPKRATDLPSPGIPIQIYDHPLVAEYEWLTAIGRAAETIRVLQETH